MTGLQLKEKTERNQPTSLVLNTQTFIRRRIPQSLAESSIVCFLHLQRMLPFQTNFLDLLTCSFEPQKGPVQHASAQGELVSIAA